METIARPDGTPIAVEKRHGAGPTIVFLPGYASDMMGTKALALDDWATASGRALVRFDYGGCGASGGTFADQTLDDWLGDALNVIDMIAGPVLIVGSSMGGWIMLLAALARPDPIVGMVGIAAAPDFTEWGFDDDQKAVLARDGRITTPSDYGDPLVTTHQFWRSGQQLRVLDRVSPITVPARLIHGQCDDDVPWRLSIELSDRLGSPDVRTTLVKDGDHRLSRETDIALLIRAVESLLEV